MKINLALLFFFFSISLNFFSQNSNSDCATMEKKAWQNKLKQMNSEKKLIQNPGTSQIIYMPYQLHIVKKTDSTNTVTLQNLYHEIDSLNYFYANAGLGLYECAAPEIIYDDSLYDFEQSTEEVILFTQHYTANIINIFVPHTVTYSGSAVCGYASYPPSLDYLMISSTCATNGSTIAHELGHYLGLMHTHGGSPDELVDGSNCSTEGDMICDTPADPTLSNSNVNSSCIYTGTATDLNGMVYVPDVNNIMSYSRKLCRNKFSNNQYSVMNTTFQNERFYLNCVTTSMTENETTNFSFIVFPNPGLNELTIEMPLLNGKNQIFIRDICGKLVFSSETETKKTIINTSNFKGGAYFITLSNSGKKATKKWIRIN